MLTTCKASNCFSPYNTKACISVAPFLLCQFDVGDQYSVIYHMCQLDWI